MPVKRRIPKQRLVAGEELTQDRLYYLIEGELMIGCSQAPFSSDVEARRCWHMFRDEVLAARSKTPTGFRPSYPPGTRPWAFWIFECGLTEAPTFEFAELEKLNMIDAEERDEVKELARERWEQYTCCWVPVWRQRAQRVSTDELLRFWPHIPELDEQGKLSWTSDDPRLIWAHENTL